LSFFYICEKNQLVFGTRESDLQRKVQNRRGFLKRKKPKDFIRILKARALDNLAEEYKLQLQIVDSDSIEEDKDHSSTSETVPNRQLQTRSNMAHRELILPRRFRKYLFTVFILFQS
jgi:hypothetical protein